MTQRISRLFHLSPPCRTSQLRKQVLCTRMNTFYHRMSFIQETVFWAATMSQVLCRCGRLQKVGKSFFCYPEVWAAIRALRESAAGHRGKDSLGKSFGPATVEVTHAKWHRQGGANYLDVPCSKPCCFEQEWRPHTKLTLDRLCVLHTRCTDYMF